MCGIVGYKNDFVTSQDLRALRQVLIESRIRGKHASGLAWYNGKKIQHLVVPQPIDKLLEHFDVGNMVYNGKIAMIGHTRYSTSNLSFNQPIVGEHLAIAHNGVVTQRQREYWEQDFGYKCEGKNDSELLLRALEEGDDPMTQFPDASIAMVALNNNGLVSGRRNGLRPLWRGWIGHGTVFASTRDILERARAEDIYKLRSLSEDKQRG